MLRHGGARGGAWAALVIWLFASYVGHASAQSIENARRLYLEADFEAAVQELESVLDRMDLDRADAAEAHRYLATLRAQQLDPEAAARHARAAVALDPEISAPAGSSPDVARLFDSARDATGGSAARLRVETVGEPERDETVIAATLDPAPVLLVAELRLRCSSGDVTARETAEPPRVELTLAPDDDVIECDASAHTQAGAELLSSRHEVGVDDGDAAHVAPDEPEDDEGGSALPWLLVAGGAVAVGATVVLVVLASSADTATVNAPTVMGPGW